MYYASGGRYPLVGSGPVCRKFALDLGRNNFACQAQKKFFQATHVVPTYLSEYSGTRMAKYGPEILVLVGNIFFVVLGQYVIHVRRIYTVTLM